MKILRKDQLKGSHRKLTDMFKKVHPTKMAESIKDNCTLSNTSHRVQVIHDLTHEEEAEVGLHI